MIPRNPPITHNSRLRKAVLKWRPIPAKNIGIKIPYPIALTLFEISVYSSLAILDTAIPKRSAPIAPWIPLISAKYATNKITPITIPKYTCLARRCFFIIRKKRGKIKTETSPATTKNIIIFANNHKNSENSWVSLVLSWIITLVTIIAINSTIAATVKISRPIVDRNFPRSLSILAVTPRLEAATTLAIANDFTKFISKDNPKRPATTNGIKNATIEPANILPFITLNNPARSISSRPIRKNKKNTPIEMKSSIASIGWTIAKSAGPTIIPARTFPRIVGWLILCIISPNNLAATINTARYSIASNTIRLSNCLWSYSFWFQ